MKTITLRRSLQLGLTFVFMSTCGLVYGDAAQGHVGQVAAADIKRTVKWGTPEPVVVA